MWKWTEEIAKTRKRETNGFDMLMGLSPGLAMMCFSNWLAPYISLFQAPASLPLFYLKSMGRERGISPPPHSIFLREREWEKKGQVMEKCHWKKVPKRRDHKSQENKGAREAVKDNQPWQWDIFGCQGRIRAPRQKTGPWRLKASSEAITQNSSCLQRLFSLPDRELYWLWVLKNRERECS